MTEAPDLDIAVFTEALRLSASERAAYLDRACAGNRGRRDRVEVLLLAHDQAGDFLAQAPPGVPKTATPLLAASEKPGDRIGRYRLLEQIGEGGCGVVFMAEQEEPVRRRVALKIVKPGMDTKNVVTRFEAERQALALMDHPNVAHVLDAGATPCGRPYFVMELVNGARITEYCDRHFLDVRSRLELFIQVCHAVQHAHQKGIIHRDLKPSNILVTTGDDGKPVSKIIDFGIAKATAGQLLTDKTIFTALELLIGTPDYMSPEQASLSRADVDTRSDIYSLGVLLYELLTGTTPFDTRELLKAGIDEVRRVIREEEPPRPSTKLSAMTGADLAEVSLKRRTDPSGVIRETRGDLDWIVMKALEKERARRYAGANELALDIQRYLASEAIVARPPSNAYRFRKLAARNKRWFASACLVFVSLLTLGVALAVSKREKHALRKAELAQWALVDSLRQSLGASGANARALVVDLTAALRGESGPGEINALLAAPSQNDLASHPEAVEQLFTRAEAFARHELWSEAEADAETILRYRPETSDSYHLIVPLFLITDSRRQYDSMREKILVQFGGTSNAYVADRMAKDCLVLPEEGAGLSRFAAMADFAVGCPKVKNPFFDFSEALAEYRRGRFESAAKWASPHTNDAYLCLRCECLEIAAMSQWQMGLRVEARGTLDEAARIVSSHIPQPEGADLGFDWRDWIIADTLLQEGASLMGQDLRLAVRASK